MNNCQANLFGGMDTKILRQGNSRKRRQNTNCERNEAVVAPRDTFENYTITRAAVVDSNMLVFCAQRDDPETDTRLVNCKLDINKWGWLGFKHFASPRIDSGVQEDGSPIALFVNAHLQVVSFQYDNGGNGLEDLIPTEVALAGPRNIRFIDRHFYAVGLDTSLTRRLGPNRWEKLHDSPDGPGLRGVDGFSETEIYVTGNDNLIGLYDGTKFHRLEYPAQIKRNSQGDPFHCDTVLCATDDHVYLGGFNGELVRGREAQWELLISAEERSIGNINKLVWFRDTLYAGTDNALWRYEDGRWVYEQFEDSTEKPLGFGYLDANDEIMLLAGPYSIAYTRDGKQWTVLYRPYEEIDLVRVQAMEQMVDDLRGVRDIAETLADEPRNDQ